MMNKELGRRGEEIAVRYLQKKGYGLLDRNYYTRFGELDIICEKNKELIFVEVKTRKSVKYGSPEESITAKKKEHLRKAALIYIDTHHRPFQGMRFDVIAILLEKEDKKINHIKNAF